MTRLETYDVAAQNGGLWFFLPTMIIFFITFTEIVTEKELKLRLGMRMMGLNNAVYWIVWQITVTIMVLLSTLLLIASGAAAQFSVFLNSNFFAVFFAFFIFGMAVMSFAFFLSTLISRTKTAQTAAYAVILVGFIFQFIL